MTKKLNLKPKETKSKILNFRVTPALAEKFKKRLKELDIKHQHFFVEIVEAFINGRIG